MLKSVQIINSHGIKGGVKVRSVSDDIKKIEKINTLYLKDKTPLKILKTQYIKNLAIIYFEGIENRNQSDDLKGEYLYVNEEELKDLKDGQYYVKDLIGAKIYDKSDGYIGILKDVISSSANDVYVIDNLKEGEILIPAVKEFILEIDIEKKIIIVKLIEGMI